MSHRQKFEIPSLDKLRDSDDEQQEGLSFRKFKKVSKLEKQQDVSSSEVERSKIDLLSSEQSSNEDVGKQSAEKLEKAPVADADSASSSKSHPSKSSTWSVIVSHRQKGNSVLRYVRNIVWEFGETKADFVLGQCCCALFLSLKFHKVHPTYIHQRMKEVGHKYAVQVLFVLVDVMEPENTLRELNSVCYHAEWTLILAWSPEEVGEYIESYKIYENKPAEFLMTKSAATDSRSRLAELLTCIKPITKTDADSLIDMFGSLRRIAEATEEELSLCPGMGRRKAKKLYEGFAKLFSNEACSDELKNDDELLLEEFED
ncbi:DNA excision repair protein ERCC-1 [Trichinella pseudospiralis]|uniref:DNA excision repair protein ERCC-1 n=1 Tax=Trichinella pseudospiralis TaxID=6337 RepID=A0A0V1G2K5_TRIPS|nr:DNA excision repair protein ERCC-1 [Trichinella pseudospiralis]